jgi:hypothetical protein
MQRIIMGIRLMALLSQTGFANPQGLLFNVVVNAGFNESTLTSCLWDSTEGTHWDNPTNTNYSGTTGSYICPCM